MGAVSAAAADKLPPVNDPRATDGDHLHEPKWDKRLTITVEPKKADPSVPPPWSPPAARLPYRLPAHLPWLPVSGH